MNEVILFNTENYSFKYYLQSTRYSKIKSLVYTYILIFYIFPLRVKQFRLLYFTLLTFFRKRDKNEIILPRARVISTFENVLDNRFSC